MKTIENCRVITKALADGLGFPEVYKGKCSGYSTENDDEPCDKCKRCKYLVGGE